LQVEKGALQTTSYAGLPLLTELAHQTGIVKKLNGIEGLWERHGDYHTADYILGLAMTLIAGGEGLEDTRLLRNDSGLRQLALPDVPSANSFGRFLRRFSHGSIYQLGETVAGQAVEGLKPGETVTLDIDASAIESDKQEAKMTFQGFRGYYPLLAWLAEPNVFLGGVFRDGNASPHEHLLPLLKYCHRRIPQGVAVRLRSDSAAYHLDIMDYCHKGGLDFAICAPLNEGIREVVEELPDKVWQLVVEDEQSYLLAETVYAPGGGCGSSELPAFRLVVKKYLKAQLELFKDPVDYHVVITNLDSSWSALEVLRFYNRRGTAEKMIAELKNGFGLDRLPCGDLKANAAFFQTCLLAYNLVQTFKRVALPKHWGSYGIKNLRFRLLCQAAIVVRHARRLILKLAEAFPFFDVFEQARWSVLSPQLAIAAT
jgi:hypothetical protein